MLGYDGWQVGGCAAARVSGDGRGSERGVRLGSRTVVRSQVQGRQLYRGTEHLEATATVRVANMETTADAQAAISCGKQIVESRFRQYTAAGSTGNKRLPADQPRFASCLQNEQPQAPSFVSGVAPAIMREARMVRKWGRGACVT